MKRSFGFAGGWALLASLGWWAAMIMPPIGFSGCAAGEGARAKLRVLEEILSARNDNDPRLDSDFNGLSSKAKRLFRKRYREIPPERRNERGTIVYLLGKNIASKDDWDFLREVVGEPSCLSLSDCSKPSEPGGSSFGDEVTLAYPPLVALKQIERLVEARHSVLKEALAVIAAAQASKTPAVAKMGDMLETRFSP